MEQENETSKSFRTWKAENAVFDKNPLPRATNLVIPVRQKPVSRATTDLMKSQHTADLVGLQEFTRIKWVDEEHYVKIFAATISDSYKLNAAGIRVLLIILNEYIKQEMRKGAVETVELVVTKKSLNGKQMPCSLDTWTRGLKNLTEHKFIWPRAGDTWWLSPQHMFKGERLRVVDEYHLLPRNGKFQINADINTIETGITEINDSDQREQHE